SQWSRHALGSCRIIAANNRCKSGCLAALPAHLFSINPHQRVITPLTCIWLPATLGIRGCFITAASS
ncbi:hypothetical protein KKI90_21965, partial [Xenorhabdus bovienii]|uniref:hypothetical protein n=1 Tax=Xenorhabdus bovienii TaxID=40576 RepID=UPI00237C6742